MPLEESYVLYNNKGGVGKSTLCFHLATEYAHRHPDKVVLLIDACPQASLSSTLYNTRDINGIDVVSELSRQAVDLDIEPPRRRHGVEINNNDIVFPCNICGYLALATKRGINVQPSWYEKFLVRPSERNNSLPGNIQLLAGDGSLELLCRSLDFTRRAPPSNYENPWFDITTLLKDFVTQVTGDERQWVVFIDTNPAFTIYTEMSIAAGTRLIIPCTSDDYSLNAMLAMFQLVYGWANPNPTFSSYAQYTFAHLAQENGLQLPKIHMFINNRTTTYNNRSSAAFNAFKCASTDEAFRFYGSQLGPAGATFPASNMFTAPPNEGVVVDNDTFMRRHFHDMKDMHQFAIICSHIGCPLYAMTTRKVELFNEQQIPINSIQLEGHRDAIRRLAAAL